MVNIFLELSFLRNPSPLQDHEYLPSQCWMAVPSVFAAVSQPELTGEDGSRWEHNFTIPPHAKGLLLTSPFSPQGRAMLPES